jgi:uncharacterized protein DUF5662
MSEIKTGYSTMPKEWLEAYEDSLTKHIRAVQEVGKKLGVALYLLDTHDASKYAEQEFPFYARQFHGDKGDPKGFSKAWLHHIHYNPHHPQHWIFPDRYDLKGADLEDGVMEMPESYALEMIADWIGASVVYTLSEDMTDWLDKNAKKILLHSKTEEYVKAVLLDLGYRDLMFKREKDRYDRLQSGY